MLTTAGSGVKTTTDAVDMHEGRAGDEKFSLFGIKP
jgi:hypothetical protein